MFCEQTLGPSGGRGDCVEHMVRVAGGWNSQKHGEGWGSKSPVKHALRSTEPEHVAGRPLNQKGQRNARRNQSGMTHCPIRPATSPATHSRT